VPTPPSGGASGEIGSRRRQHTVDAIRTVDDVAVPSKRDGMADRDDVAVIHDHELELRECVPEEVGVLRPDRVVCHELGPVSADDRLARCRSDLDARLR
jgi:hypothetical protein